MDKTLQPLFKEQQLNDSQHHTHHAPVNKKSIISYVFSDHKLKHIVHSTDTTFTVIKVN